MDGPFGTHKVNRTREVLEQYRPERRLTARNPGGRKLDAGCRGNQEPDPPVDRRALHTHPPPPTQAWPPPCQPRPYDRSLTQPGHQARPAPAVSRSARDRNQLRSRECPWKTAGHTRSHPLVILPGALQGWVWVPKPHPWAVTCTFSTHRGRQDRAREDRPPCSCDCHRGCDAVHEPHGQPEHEPRPESGPDHKSSSRPAEEPEWKRAIFVLGQRAACGGPTHESTRPVTFLPVLMPHGPLPLREGWGGAVSPQTPVAKKCRLSAREIPWRLVIAECSGAPTDATYYCIGSRARNLPVNHADLITIRATCSHALGRLVADDNHP